MRDILGRVSIISGASAIAATLLLGLIVISVMARTPDRAVLDEGVQPAEEQQSLDRVPEEAQPKEVENLNGALERLGHIRAEESTAFQAYNNALYEQKQLGEEIAQLEADPVVAEQPTDELEAKRQQLTETADQIAARKERFESVEAEKQAYLDSLSNELRAQMEAEQQRRIEEAQAAAAAAAAEVRERLASERERLASEASAPAITPPQLLEVSEAAPETQGTAQLAAGPPQYDEGDVVVPDDQQQEAMLDEETEESDSAPFDPPPPPPELANAVVAEAASFVGTLAVEDAPETLPVQPEPAPAVASAAADQYVPPESTSSLQQQDDATTEGLQPSSSETGPQPAGENRTAGPVTRSGQAVVDEGAKYSGTPYKLGGVPECVPYETMDCSCLTMTVYAEFGIYLPDSPEAQMGYGTPVSGEPQAGDLIGWSEDRSGVITHVGIATGNGTTIHASGYAGYVTETPIEYIPGYVGARRLL